MSRDFQLNLVRTVRAEMDKRFAKLEPRFNEVGKSIEIMGGLFEDLLKREPERGEQGPRGAAGENGKSVTMDDVRPILEAELSKWALDFERRATGILERAVDRLPKPKDGKDGADGFDLNDLELNFDGRTLSAKFESGERKKEWSWTVPTMQYRGIYATGENYTPGDCVTWAGSLWVAKVETKAKPSEGSDWQLAVKKGRDGKSNV